MLTAVIFDMDGTLVDTERLAVKAWTRASSEYGYEFSEDEITRSIIGRTRADIIAFLEDEVASADIALKIYEVHAVYRAQLIKEFLKYKAGAPEVLASLKAKGFKLAVATSTYRAAAIDTLRRAGILDYFDVVVCGDEISHGKPNPEAFLVTAEHLGTKPEECAVVEDSYNGVRAGAAAQMHVVMIPDLRPADDEMRSLANEIIPSLFELEEALGL